MTVVQGHRQPAAVPLSRRHAPPLCIITRRRWLHDGDVFSFRIVFLDHWPCLLLVLARRSETRGRLSGTGWKAALGDLMVLTTAPLPSGGWDLHTSPYSFFEEKQLAGFLAASVFFTRRTQGSRLVPTSRLGKSACMSFRCSGCGRCNMVFLTSSRRSREMLVSLVSGVAISNYGK